MTAELAERIASDLVIPSIKGEASAHYEARVLYSALRCWVEAACIDDGADGKVGVSKQRISRRVGHLLDFSLEALPGARQWFCGDGKDNKRELPARVAYNALLDIDDLAEVPDTGNVICTRRNNQGITEEISLITGFYDRPDSGKTDQTTNGPYVTSGLATLASSTNSDFLFSGMTPYEAVLAMKSCFTWKSMDDVGLLEVPNPLDSAWSVARSTAVDDATNLFNQSELVAMRRREGQQYAQEYYLAERRLGGLFAAQVPSDIAQTVFLAQKKNAGHAVAFRTGSLDDLYIRLNGILGIMPGDEQRVLRSLVWPDESINDTSSFVVRSVALPIIKKAAARSCIDIREY